MDIKAVVPPAPPTPVRRVDPHEEARREAPRERERRQPRDDERRPDDDAHIDTYA
ncbi:MAG: hypothetical protein H6977_19895 [Gammaproteobacteria bacterium]|nr:hypothetical protein [Gammaproteobacteria bacterium]MCP5202265.1 hypothetical protein [Gammaproteobacteria bacterium]